MTGFKDVDDHLAKCDARFVRTFEVLFAAFRVDIHGFNGNDALIYLKGFIDGWNACYKDKVATVS